MHGRKYAEAVFPRQLEYLVALERERHFGRAARACHVSQPTLSTGLRKLEAELGVPLVRRGQRFEGFTREGERVVLWAHRILADYDGLGHELSQIRGGLEGTLRVGAIPTSVPAVSLVTSPFCERHPLMHVEVVSLSSREIERRLDAFELDAGLTYLDNEPLGNMRAVPLYRERYVLLCAVDGPFAGRATVEWAEAATVPLCLLTPDMQNRRIIDELLRGVGATPQPTLESNSMIVLFAHVRTGRWASVMPAKLADTLGLTETIRAIPIVEPEAVHTIGLVVPSREPMTPLTAALVAEAQRLAPQLEEIAPGERSTDKRRG
jgi:DNA-binding transcriptional LysR family regulator